jgi:phage terminase small subunit
MPKGDKLTDKQEKFCHEYLIDLNATQAAIRSKYSKKGARVRGFELLANSNVQRRIAELRKEIAQDEGTLTPKQISAKFSQAANAAKLKEVKPGEGLKALENLAKIHGMYEQDNRQKAPQIIISTDDIQKPDNSGTSGAE